jgi:hypothetical protein
MRWTEERIHRYVPEFDFRYRAAPRVDHGERVEKTILGLVGRRLTYRSEPKKYGKRTPCGGNRS